MSLESLIDRLTEIRKAEIITVSSVKGKPVKETPVKETQLGEMEPELQGLYNALLNSPWFIHAANL